MSSSSHGDSSEKTHTHPNQDMNKIKGNSNDKTNAHLFFHSSNSNSNSNSNNDENNNVQKFNKSTSAERKDLDPKSLRRLAQNREAARKSRMRKKAYVQQLENSRNKLAEMERRLKENQVHNLTSQCGHDSSAITFNTEYSKWVEEDHRQMNELRQSLQSRLGDAELRSLVDAIILHYEDLFRIKSVVAKADVFHLVSGMWKSPAERCFMWMGGFRPSELLKILIPQIEPLTEQQLMSICTLQQQSQQAEDALSQGMEALQQSLADTLSAGSLGASSNVSNYMGQMAIAMGKLSTLESFVLQADKLRHQTLKQMHLILTTRQAARGLLAMGDYISRLRALSSLWLARPKDS